MNQPCEKVVLTRRRWDAYMVLLFLGALAIAVLCVWHTGKLRFTIAPIAVIPLWLRLRYLTPRDGLLVTTIRSTPGAVILLRFIATALVSMAILFAVHVYVFGHSFGAPLQRPHAVILFLPPFTILIIGAIWAGRIAKTQKTLASRRDENEHSP